MEAFMDTTWENIMAIGHYVASLLDHLLTPFHVFGPIFILGLLAFITLLTTKFFNKVIVTRRYIELEKEFRYWFKIREEALKNVDHEKGNRLARNIDQAKLNKAYYDYFLEGFLLGMVRNVLPILLMVMYVNEYYRAETLSRLFGKPYVFSFSFPGGEAIFIGAVFTYLLALILFHIGWHVVKWSLKKRAGSRTQRTEKVNNKDRMTFRVFGISQ